MDILAFFSRLYAFCTAPSKLDLRQFWRSVVLGHQDAHPSPSDYGPVPEVPEEYDDMKPMSSYGRRPSMSDPVIFDADSPRSSRHSDDTLREAIDNPIPVPKHPLLLRRISQAAYATLERFLVFAAFGMVLSGVVVYTGGCRDSYINGCLAHLISKNKEVKIL